MIYKIVEATRDFNPVVYTEACEEYPTLGPGDVAVDYSFDLSLFYEKGRFAVMYRDRVEIFKDPLPVLRLLLPDTDGTWEPFEE